MNFDVAMTADEEARLSAAARKLGVAPADLLKRLAFDNLPSLSKDRGNTLDAKLRMWQQQDETPLVPDVSISVLLSKWADEDASMTDEEREGEDQLWDDIESSIRDRGTLRLRHFSK